MKTPFISREDLETIVAEFPTPFHLYDEKGIREKARAVNQAFSWNKGFKEYFAVKATPTPAILKNIGRIIAKSFMDQKIDAVMTVATKGVPLANAVANVLNVPFVIVRRDLKITEGSTVSVNYVSGSSGDRIEKMFLSKRSLKAGSRVLIVDDFLKGGGTVNGMISLLREFDSELAGVAVFADNAQEEREKQFDYKSLLKVTNIDVKNQAIDVAVGNIFDEDK